MIKFISAQREAIAHRAEAAMSLFLVTMVANALFQSIKHSVYVHPGHLKFDWLPLEELGLSILIQLLAIVTIKALFPKASTALCLFIGDRLGDVVLIYLMMHHH